MWLSPTLSSVPETGESNRAWTVNELLIGLLKPLTPIAFGVVAVILLFNMILFPMMDRMERNSDSVLKMVVQLNTALDKIQTIQSKQDQLSTTMSAAAAEMQKAAQTLAGAK